MKNSMINLTITAVVVLTTFSFKPVEKVKKEIKVASSKILWKGYKVTGSHEGSIAIKSAFLTFEDEKLSGGEFVIDMTTISSTDLQGEYKGRLDGHLKSDDFFGVDTHPTAVLVFKEVQAEGKYSYSVTGDLTIKGKTNPVTFTISLYGSKATATLKVDRSKYDVRYGSQSFFDGLKDKVIYDEFNLVADLEF